MSECQKNDKFKSAILENGCLINCSIFYFTISWFVAARFEPLTKTYNKTCFYIVRSLFFEKNQTKFWMLLFAFYDFPFNLHTCTLPQN